MFYFISRMTLAPCEIQISATKENNRCSLRHVLTYTDDITYEHYRNTKSLPLTR